ncbi:MAG: TIGR04255 family protein, partial [Anaerolineae bacterium]
ELAAMLHIDAVPNPDMAIHYLRASNGDDVLALRSGIVTDPGEPGPKFVLDFDAFRDVQSSLDSVVGVCEQYHSTIYGAFRWAIREDSLAVFGVEGTR